MKHIRLKLCLPVVVLYVSSIAISTLRYRDRVIVYEQGNNIVSFHSSHIYMILAVLLTSFAICYLLASITRYKSAFDGVSALPASVLGVTLSFLLPSRLDFSPYAYSGQPAAIGNCFISVSGWCLALTIYGLIHRSPKPPSPHKRTALLIQVIVPLSALMLALIFDYAISWASLESRRMGLNAEWGRAASILMFLLPYAISLIAGGSLALVHLKAAGGLYMNKPFTWIMAALLLIFILRPLFPYALRTLFGNEGYYLCSVLSGFMFAVLTASLLKESGRRCL